MKVRARRQKRRPRRKRPAPRKIPATRRPAAAETHLLALAEGLGALLTSARTSPRDSLLTEALTRMSGAFQPGAALPVELFGGWLRSRGDKMRALALVWAREQVRRALRDILEHEVVAGRSRADLPPDVLAWLVLAGCEATVHEPPGAAADRFAQLRDFLRVPDPLRVPAPAASRKSDLAGV